MERYITGRYVAIDWTDAVRLAQLDNTALEEIRHRQNVELLHRTDWWAWWSDERLTTAIGLPDDLRPDQLSADAESLISEVWESLQIRPQCGWTMLANVTRISERELLQTSIAVSDSLSSQWEKLTVLFRDGEMGVLYKHHRQNEAEYKCNILYELPQLQESHLI
ncbi:MAG: hypothetical protein AAF716_09490 [Cyanobacteria bacterium P01_D01_bin.1]